MSKQESAYERIQYSSKNGDLNQERRLPSRAKGKEQQGGREAAEKQQ